MPEASTRLSNDEALSFRLQNTPPSVSYRFCVPDEWYRRPSRIAPSKSSFKPTEETLKRLSELDDDDSEGENTAKQKRNGNGASVPNSPVTDSSASPGSSGTFSSARLSTMFGSWLGSSSSQDLMNEEERCLVSEPIVMDNNGRGPGGSVDEDDFERMIVRCRSFRPLYDAHLPVQDDLGLKGEKRAAMHNLPPDRKRYLLEQNCLMKSTPSSKSGNSPHLGYAASYGPSRAAQILPNLVPQLTGEGSLMKRLSVSWGGFSDGSPVTPSTPLAKSIFSQEERSDRPEPAPLQSQSTGSLWSNWWSSSGGEASPSPKNMAKEEKSAAWYIGCIRSRRTTDSKLVKHLISLRVHLSTAKLSWVDGFLNENDGMELLGTLLSTLVAKGGKRKKLGDTEEMVLYEVLKCLRVLLNIGVWLILQSPLLLMIDVFYFISYSLVSRSCCPLPTS